MVELAAQPSVEDSREAVSGANFLQPLNHGVPGVLGCPAASQLQEKHLVKQRQVFVLGQLQRVVGVVVGSQPRPSHSLGQTPVGKVGELHDAGEAGDKRARRAFAHAALAFVLNPSAHPVGQAVFDDVSQVVGQQQARLDVVDAAPADVGKVVQGEVDCFAGVQETPGIEKILRSQEHLCVSGVVHAAGPRDCQAGSCLGQELLAKFHSVVAAKFRQQDGPQEVEVQAPLFHLLVKGRVRLAVLGCRKVRKDLAKVAQGKVVLAQGVAAAGVGQRVVKNPAAVMTELFESPLFALGEVGGDGPPHEVARHGGRRGHGIPLETFGG